MKKQKNSNTWLFISLIAFIVVVLLLSNSGLPTGKVVASYGEDPYVAEKYVSDSDGGIKINNPGRCTILSNPKIGNVIIERYDNCGYDYNGKRIEESDIINEYYKNIITVRHSRFFKTNVATCLYVQVDCSKIGKKCMMGTLSGATRAANCRYV